MLWIFPAQTDWSDSDYLDKSAIMGAAVPISAPNAAKPAEIPGQLLRDLREYLATRQVSNGIALLDDHAPLLAALNPAQRNAARFLGCVAQWIDIGYASPDLLEKLLAPFPKER